MGSSFLHLILTAMLRRAAPLINSLLSFYGRIRSTRSFSFIHVLRRRIVTLQTARQFRLLAVFLVTRLLMTICIGHGL